MNDFHPVDLYFTLHVLIIDGSVCIYFIYSVAFCAYHVLDNEGYTEMLMTPGRTSAHVQNKGLMKKFREKLVQAGVWKVLQKWVYNIHVHCLHIGY